MTTYMVEKYKPSQQVHYLIEEGEEDRKIRVDLLVSGEIGVDKPEDLVGRRVEIGRLDPYLMIANDIDVKENEQEVIK